MNNIFITTIRFGAILGLAFFAFIHQAFAAPIVTPVQVSANGSGAVALYAKAAAADSWDSVTVWFQWGETPAPTNVVGMGTVFSQGGTFEQFRSSVNGLTPGVTYYFQSVSIQDGVTVSSPVSAYKVPGGTQPVAPVYVAPVATTVVAPAQSAQNVVVNRTIVVKPVVQAESTTAQSVQNAQNTGSSVEAINPNSAAVIGASGDIFPQTLVGWIGLMIALFAMVIIMKMLSESFGGRREDHQQHVNNGYAVQHA